MSLEELQWLGSQGVQVEPLPYDIAQTLDPHDVAMLQAKGVYVESAPLPEPEPIKKAKTLGEQLAELYPAGFPGGQKPYQDPKGKKL